MEAKIKGKSENIEQTNFWGEQILNNKHREKKEENAFWKGFLLRNWVKLFIFKQKIKYNNFEWKLDIKSKI